MSRGNVIPLRAPTLPEPGEIIAGRYRVVRKIGEGGMAAVFEVVHVRLKQRLAIKVLRPDVAGVEEHLVRFEREARTTAELRGINVAKVVDVDRLPNGLPYIVLEHLEGRDLQEEITTRGQLPIADAVDYAIQAATAMADAHAAGIVHRDLKPANLFLCPIDGESERRVVKVLDFGISRRLGDSGARLTQAGASLGTTHYMSPEQLRADDELDARTDIWSLGVILFEMLTGKTPFDGAPTALVLKIALEATPRIKKLRPDVPEELEAVVTQALNKDPRHRFASMKDFAAALAPFGHADPTAARVARRTRQVGRIGELLVNEALITREQLEWALAEQARTGRVLGQVLVEHGILSRADLMVAIAKQHDLAASVPSVSPDAPTLAPPAEAKAGARRAAWVVGAVGIVAVVAALVACVR